MAHPLSSYLSFLEGLLAADYSLHPIRVYFEEQFAEPFVFLRHDVDRFPERAVAMAIEESRLGVCSTYYFRCDRRCRFPESSVHRIRALGHEIGFHYESLSRGGGSVGRARELFARELGALREHSDVLTVAPHGAPLSAWSNMELTEELKLEELALLGDATGIDFSDILYITDSGGTFGSRHNLRDRVDGRRLDVELGPSRLVSWMREMGERRAVLSCHPERWPRTAVGLTQAWLFDLAANGLKSLVRWRART